MLTGILNINKQKCLTSHDVVNQARKSLNIKKIGHTGTLDPAATGVLILCIGKSTKLIQYLPKEKEYLAEITLGITTNTYDAEGEITSEQKVCFNNDDLLTALKKFSGKISQEVPLASATHYKGKKLYEYAHKGITITDLPRKNVTIHNINIIETTKEIENNPVIKLKIRCSEGTYIRSLANDLGKTLGYGAFLSNLHRTEASGLTIETSITIETLREAKETNKLEALIKSPSNLIRLPKYQITSDQITRIQKGQYLSIKNDILDNDQKVILVNKDLEIIAIAEYLKSEQIIKPTTVLI